MKIKRNPKITFMRIMCELFLNSRITDDVNKKQFSQTENLCLNTQWTDRHVVHWNNSSTHHPNSFLFLFISDGRSRKYRFHSP